MFLSFSFLKTSAVNKKSNQKEKEIGLHIYHTAITPR